jgi:hypothetical protein
MSRSNTPESDKPSALKVQEEKKKRYVETKTQFKTPAFKPDFLMKTTIDPMRNENPFKPRFLQ